MLRMFKLSSALLMAGCVSAAIAGEPVRQYISDRPFMVVDTQQQWGVLGFNSAAYMPGNPSPPLQVKDRQYAKGLGTHAASKITVLLNGQYASFECQVGVQFQKGSPASVIFRVYADDVKKFDSGVRREKDDPMPVKIPVAGVSTLRLEVNDAGDGITCDSANWLDPVLTLDPAAAAKPGSNLDMAPFARLITCDPARMDGARTHRLQEFDEADLQLDRDVLASADGTFTVPAFADGRGVIGLRWLERRRIRELGIEFPDEASKPSTNGVELQAWFMASRGASPGGSAWQGNWVPMKGNIEQEKTRWRFSLDWLENNIPAKGILKVRWVFPKSAKPVVVKRLIAITDSKTSTADLVLQIDGASPGHSLGIEMYNGTILTPNGEVTRYKWDGNKPFHVKVRYCDSNFVKTDRTVLRLRLPDGRIGVAVDDILANPCVYVPDFNLFAAQDPPKVTLEEYKKQIAGKQTILDQVKSLPDQTFERTITALHCERQDFGPTLLSLACNNRKYLVGRDGSISFEQSPAFNNLVDHAGRMYLCSINPKFGNGAADTLERHLQGGWLPIPVTTIKQGGLVYQQRSFVAPYGKPATADEPRWVNNKPLFVAEITVTNPLPSEADASIALDFIANTTNGAKMTVTTTDYGVVAEAPKLALASVNTHDAGVLKSNLKDGTLTLSGKLPAKTSAKCVVFIPGWEIDRAELAALKADETLVSATEQYWNDVMSQAVHINVPDTMLNNVIKASQVHCFLAARTGSSNRVAPWIGSINYGPLDSEAQSVIRGMAFMGQEDFARRSLDYFISRYNKAGYLQPTYTLMGTGWNLWNVGEFFGLYRDTAWMKQNAPEVARVCDWIMRQRAKTMKLDSRGDRLPEYGLTPPGAMADWEVFSYYFYANGYFHIGLNAAAKALAAINYPGADKIAANAADYREQIQRAFHYVQAQAPVFPLKNGKWVPEYPTQLYCPAPTDHFYRGEDFNRSWCYDVELGAHHLVPQGVLDPNSRDVEWMMDHMEDVQFLNEGWFACSKPESKKNPFDFGGFGKIQPYYARNAEVYALRDDVKPFIRAYFNTLPTLLNREDLSVWEHFNATGAFNKTHETGYFLHQTRLMLVQERSDSLWLAPFVTDQWLKDGMTISVANAPTEFGPVSYQITSHVAQGNIKASIEPPKRTPPREIVLRLRHPDGKPIRSVTVNGKPHTALDPQKQVIRIFPDTTARLVVRANY